MLTIPLLRSLRGATRSALNRQARRLRAAVLAAAALGCSDSTGPTALPAAVTLLRNTTAVNLPPARAEVTRDGVLVRGQVATCALLGATARATRHGATVGLELGFREADVRCIVAWPVEYLAVVEGVPRGDYRLVVVMRHFIRAQVLDTTLTAAP